MKESEIRTAVVKFEDMMDDTRGEVEKICKVVGIEYEERMANFHKKSTNQGRVLAGGTRADRALDRSRATPSIDLTTEEQENVLEEVGPLAKTLGYV
ncbi:hypothetical protein GGP79_002347 [Salinibacter ruber]|mgnify:FL=1|uniref:sulfotransferase n=1 Tax=Salinibacter ruber TaxID=146919 RepID=UPI0021697F36|nr:sulfotransferase [Salinibacter ruber]MCS3754383.1 hypothetical protein [Salinibacter ruber]